ncbi:Outer membrane protein assembly factor YaeT precursor [Pseudomonas synxantha]|uniref:OmpA family protein n=1 Tax=Pseudomonas synxantha TaxID=47883 RepID=UPI000F58A09D|nr:type VI secretion system ImpA family N-terminal domain-containing protein [Pseudomonas synxantha]AZE72299.1 Outer membrane protein assembly factor YaeT precursor [Pseudomonas synxantha]
MTALFEMRIRVGGDPRGFSEFTVLREELAKLSHPACPDVDWAKVEQSCLALFQHNGADLQTACFYTLARGQRHGLEGITQGVVLLEALSCEWTQLWPPMASVRLDLLGWLFDQLQLLMRSMAMTAHSVPALVQLDAELARLHARLLPQGANPLLTLQALRHQVGNLNQRLEQSYASGERVLAPVRLITPTWVTPVVILPPPDVEPRRRRLALWLFARMLIIALLAGLGWRAWLTNQAPPPLMPEPVRLDSLSLFDAGSAILKPGSTKVLINALVGIKAQPGWLIVIAGHTDATGVMEQNLALSHARASAVRDWMQQMGDIADSCFAVQGLAANQPIASNATEAGRTANRRVDIQLVPQVGACEQTALAGESGQS